MTTKTILIATGIYPPQIGGPSTYAKLMNDYLIRDGYVVKVLSFDEVRKYPKIMRHILYVLKLTHAALGVQVMFVQDTVSVGLPAVIVSKILRKKMILRVPGDYAWEQGVQRFNVKEGIDAFQETSSRGLLKLLRNIQSFVARNANLVIVPSHYFKTVVSKWGVSENNITVIYNGIEEVVVPQSKTKTPDEFVLFSSGRLVPWKGFKELVEVFLSIKESIPHAKLLIAGDGPYKQELLSLVESKNLLQDVSLLGRVPRDELFSIMKASDIFILNSSFESFSFQIVEAMALGMAIVSADSGSLKEIVENNVSGILFDAKKPASIVPVVIDLYKNPQKREKLGENALRRSKDFSFENTINELKKIL